MIARNSRLFSAIFLLAAAGGAVLCLEMGTAARVHIQPLRPPLSRPLPPQLLRFSLMAALGDHARVAADWAYVDCLQYLGNVVNRQDGRFRQTEALYREVLWLDPGFHHAIREGASVLGWNQLRIEESQRFMEDAIRFDPSHKRIRLYLAGLAYAKAKDPVAMVDILRPELMQPDCPEDLIRMVGNLYLKEKNWEGAKTYWTWVRSRAKEPQTRAAATEALRMAREKIPWKRWQP